MRRLALALLTVPALVSAQARPNTETLQRQVDSLAKAFLAGGTTPSVTLAMTRGGKTLVSASWGKADLEQGVDATPASIYEIGSATKQFTSSAIMQLVEQDKVKLEEPINTYLPGLPEAWRAVTVHQLLNHTSGIPNYTAVAAWATHWAEEKRPDSLIVYTAKLNDTLVNAPAFSMSQAYAAGAICSTAGDLAKWNYALHTGKVVSPASYALMTTPDGAAAASRYGFGLSVDTIAGHKLVSHGGNIPGFATANSWVADEELSVTVFANAIAGNPGQLLRQVMRAALGLPPAAPVTRRPPTENDE
jgi:CubicO group peptidase (beta-lactamase class C family)